MKSKFVLGLLLLNAMGLGYLWYQYDRLLEKTTQNPHDIITARAIVLIDSMGVERAILGAQLPDPTFLGYRFARGGSVSGLMLFDSEGQERGGYVADDDYGNVFLTLDSKSSQQALFLSEPQGGATLQVWGRNGNKISLGAYDDTLAVDLNINGKPLQIHYDE